MAEQQSVNECRPGKHILGKNFAELHHVESTESRDNTPIWQKKRRYLHIFSLHIQVLLSTRLPQTFESLSLANSERSSSVSLIWRGDSLRANIKPSKALSLSVLKLVTLVNNATAASWQTLHADSSPPDDQKKRPPTLVTWAIPDYFPESFRSAASNRQSFWLAVRKSLTIKCLLSVQSSHKNIVFIPRDLDGVCKYRLRIFGKDLYLRAQFSFPEVLEKQGRRALFKKTWQWDELGRSTFYLAGIKSWKLFLMFYLMFYFTLIFRFSLS